MGSNYLSRDIYGMYRNSHGGPGPALMGAETLMGNEVCDPLGEKLGTIREFMIEMRTGTVNYAVLSFGGFLGLGDRLFAVPWKALTLDTVNKRFLLKVDKEKLKDAPSFDKDHWPSMLDMAWATDLYAFYGVDDPSPLQ